MKFATKVAVWSTLLTAVALVVYSFALLVEMERSYGDSMDSVLSRSANHFFDELEKKAGALEHASMQEVAAAVANINPAPYYCEVLHLDGRVLYRSKVPLSKEIAQIESGAGWVSLDSKKFRAMVLNKNGIRLGLVAAANAGHSIRWDIASVMRVMLPLVLSAIGFISWFAAKRAISPLRQIAEAAGKVSLRSLGRRLPGGERMDEIGQVARAFNATLEKLEVNFEQAQRFSADASHELRTPIAVICAGLGELMHSRSLSQQDKGAVAELIEQTARVTSITDNLLMLSRADAGKLSLLLRPVDMKKMASELTSDFEAIGESNGLKIELHSDATCVARADEQMLRQVMVNLIGNALKYNRKQGRVWLKTRCVGTRVEIHIGNTGPKIPSKHRERIFERFYRAQHTSEVSGSGLGLCLGRELARAMGGDLVLLESEDDRTEFLLTLPAVERACTSAARE